MIFSGRSSIPAPAFSAEGPSKCKRTPRKSARAICLFLEAVGKVLHMRVAQMGHEAHCVADGYQHRRIARAANFDVPKSIGIGSVRLDRLNIRARDPMPPQHMGCGQAASFHIPGRLCSTTASWQSRRLRVDRRHAEIAHPKYGQFHRLDSIRRGAGNPPAKA
jgi:hypothetical protein